MATVKGISARWEATVYQDAGPLEKPELATATLEMPPA
jgi:hypothetical protein